MSILFTKFFYNQYLPQQWRKTNYQWPITNYQLWCPLKRVFEVKTFLFYRLSGERRNPVSFCFSRSFQSRWMLHFRCAPCSKTDIFCLPLTVSFRLSAEIRKDLAQNPASLPRRGMSFQYLQCFTGFQPKHRKKNPDFFSGQGCFLGSEKTP